VTDTLQFTITMSGTFAAAYFARQQPEVGELAGLFTKVDPKSLNLLPDFGDWSVALAVFIITVTIQWWSVWHRSRNLLAAGRRHDGGGAFDETRQGHGARPGIVVA